MRPYYSVFLCTMLLVVTLPACKHEPLVPPGSPVDPSVGLACDADTVYFQNQVLPILVSNCTESGCHNEQDHKEGVVTTSYQTLLSTVERVTQNDWEKNKLIKSLEETDLSERMPRNKPSLSVEQINLIKKWVLQGALNNRCDASFGGCDTIGGAVYAGFVQPLVQTQCKGCHSGNSPQGGIKLTTYAEIKTQALSGKLYDSMIRSANWMPKGGAMLDDCALAKIKTWVDAGAPEN